MFTGLVETIGTVSELKELDESKTGGGGCSMTISNAEAILDDAALGDSISVNGTCLTITEHTSSSFKVGIAPETLRRTNLGSLKVNSNVNLERALSTNSKFSQLSVTESSSSSSPSTSAPSNSRFGGHFVQGHVDTIATITSITPDGNAKVFQFEPRDKDVLTYIVEKGYVTVDGASLTITRVDDVTFEVMLVSYTQEKVVTAGKKVGEDVNVEVDMVGKYVEKSVAAYLGGRDGGSNFIESLVEKALSRKGGTLEKTVAQMVDQKLQRSLKNL